MFLAGRGRARSGEELPGGVNATFLRVEYLVYIYILLLLFIFCAQKKRWLVRRRGCAIERTFEGMFRSGDDGDISRAFSSR